MRRSRAACSWLVFLIPLACGEDEALAAKLRAQSEAAAAARREARLEAKRERAVQMEAANARNAERAQAYQKRRAAIEALTTAVDAADLPKTLAQACEARVEAQKGFFAGSTEAELDTLRSHCMTTTIETAACQAAALRGATPDLEPDVPELMDRCARRGFASDVGGAM